jgi:hypothetical protein
MVTVEVAVCEVDGSEGELGEGLDDRSPHIDVIGASDKLDWL